MRPLWYLTISQEIIILITIREGDESMRKKDNGFTLLEAVIALVLFALLLQTLLGFFSQMYVNSKRLEQRSYLVDNARLVNEFVQEKIREASKVKITAIDDKGTPDNPADDVNVSIEPITTSAENKSFNGRLVKIEMKDALGHASEIEMKAITTEGKGNYQLIYKANSSSSLISDMIENIKVKREKDSDVVEFTCDFYKKNETLDQLKLKEIFTETLAYKQKY